MGRANASFASGNRVQYVNRVPPLLGPKKLINLLPKWGQLPARLSLDNFMLAFRKRNRFRCAMEAYELARRVRWHIGLGAFRGDMPTPTDPKPNWAWYAVGM